MAIADTFLDRYLDPLSQSLSPQAAQAILALRPDETSQQWVVELARRSNAGVITAEERDELQALADAGTLISLVKAKARAAMQRGTN